MRAFAFNNGCFFHRHRDLQVKFICPFFFDGVCEPTAFYVYVFAFFFFVFLQHYPTDHLQSVFSLFIKDDIYIINNRMSTFF